MGLGKENPISWLHIKVRTEPRKGEVRLRDLRELTLSNNSNRVTQGGGGRRNGGRRFRLGGDGGGPHQ